MIHVLLQIIHAQVDFPSEGDLIEFIQNRFVESLTNAISLRIFRLRPGEDR
jgi:hypothetical protein